MAESCFSSDGICTARLRSAQHSVLPARSHGLYRSNWRAAAAFSDKINEAFVGAEQFFLLLLRFCPGRFAGGFRAAGGGARFVYVLLRGSGLFFRIFYYFLVRCVGRALRGVRVRQRAADGTRLAITKRGRQHARLLVVESPAQLLRPSGKPFLDTACFRIGRQRIVHRCFLLRKGLKRDLVSSDLFQKLVQTSFLLPEGHKPFRR